MSFHLVDAAHQLPIEKGDKQVLIALARYADHDGRNARPGTELLMTSTSASQTFVKDHLKRLVSTGLIRHVGGGMGRGNALEFAIDAERIFALALESGWRDTRKRGQETTRSDKVKGWKTAEKGRETARKGSGDDPHSVLGDDSVRGDIIGQQEAASVAALNGEPDEPVLADLHPRCDGEPMSEYLARLNNLHQEETEPNGERF